MRDRRHGAPPPPRRHRGLIGYFAIGSLCCAFLNVASHLRGKGSVVTALAAHPGTEAAGRALLYWVVGPLLLWPLWLPLAMIDLLRWMFRGD
jgi:hypothetical protein